MCVCIRIIGAPKDPWKKGKSDQNPLGQEVSV